MILPIVKEPDPILRRKAAPVREITPEILRLAQNMIETMHAAEGVGLAANQVGSSWDILVASPDGAKGKEVVLINAEILRPHGKNLSPEGCLSLPGISSEVARWALVSVRGLNRQGRIETLEADGLLAKILQHEIDHLDGRLYVDRLSIWKRQRLLNQYRSLSRTLRQIDL